MSQLLRVLMVEDSEGDARLVARALKKAGFTVHHARVDTDSALRAALEREPWDVVLLDYVMPQFSPLTALQIVRQWDPDLPCIIVSGEITDETAIEAMKAGAHDFIAKDKLIRLPQVIERETAAALARRAARDGEMRLRAIFESAADSIITIDEQGIIGAANPAAAATFGYPPEEMLGQNVSMLMPEPYRSEHQGHIERYLRTGEAHIIGIGRRVEGRRKDGTVFPIRLAVSEAWVGGRRLFTGIIHDLSDVARAEKERDRLYDAEREARAAAEEANQAKDQFLALVSHELRNPLSAIAAGVGLLRQTCTAEGIAGRALEIVQRNAALQARLVNDILDLSRLQRGTLALQRAPVELAKVVEGSCRSFEPEAVAAGLTLTCALEPGLWVLGDLDRLQQVVANLLTNSAKFTPPPGQVRVEVSRVGGPAPDHTGSAAQEQSPDAAVQAWARIAVEDTGIGISPDLLPRLFEQFRQGEIASQRAAGLGLGLALVRGIVERHGGRVWAESEGVGRGSRFIVELPLVPGPTAMPPAGRGTETDRPLRVLIVEDNADTRVAIADSLRVAGYQVRAVASGEDALDSLAEAPPDVMLVDIGLPGMDGYEFVRRARTLPGLADVPAFAVTGYGTEDDVARGREAGFVGHFVKPVNPAALMERIREWVCATPSER